MYDRSLYFFFAVVVVAIVVVIVVDGSVSIHLPVSLYEHTVLS
jgi:hypothetical protein